MDVKKELLLRSAARLYSVGIDLEGARERIRQLVDRKADYESCEMIQAVQDYTEIKKLWHDFEEEYLGTLPYAGRLRENLVKAFLKYE